jgi:hypothetical protein
MWCWGPVMAEESGEERRRDHGTLRESRARWVGVGGVPIVHASGWRRCERNAPTPANKRETCSRCSRGLHRHSRKLISSTNEVVSQCGEYSVGFQFGIPLGRKNLQGYSGRHGPNQDEARLCCVPEFRLLPRQSILEMPSAHLTWLKFALV